MLLPAAHRAPIQMWQLGGTDSERVQLQYAAKDAHVSSIFSLAYTLIARPRKTLLRGARLVDCELGGKKRRSKSHKQQPPAATAVAAVAPPAPAATVALHPSHESQTLATATHTYSPPPPPLRPFDLSTQLGAMSSPDGSARRTPAATSPSALALRSQCPPSVVLASEYSAHWFPATSSNSGSHGPTLGRVTAVSLLANPWSLFFRPIASWIRSSSLDISSSR